MKEIWKDIDDYKGYYQISNLGRVKSLKRMVNGRFGLRVVNERILRLPVNSKGYITVSLSKNHKIKTKDIHQLLAIAFLNHKPCGHKLVVDHINGNPLDNRVENLQLITTRENCSKNRKGGTSKYTGVSWNKTNRCWEAKIVINKKLKHIGVFRKEYDAHLAYQNALQSI